MSLFGKVVFVFEPTNVTGCSTCSIEATLSDNTNLSWERSA